MHIIRTTLDALTLGEPTSVHNLSVFPLLGPTLDVPDYATLDAALADDTVAVTELTDAGHVPEIRVRNRSTAAVLILEGEELVGAKQNRTVNLSILVPRESDLVIPVTCVEAGRWNLRSAAFTTAPRTHFAEGRAAKNRQVSMSMLAGGAPTADQSQVWKAIGRKAVLLDAHSDTGAMADIYEQRDTDIEDYMGGITTLPTQRGAVFVLNGVPRGLDLFDAPATCATLLPKVVRGYALDALGTRGSRAPERAAAVRPFLQSAAAADWTPFPGVGLGESWRTIGPALAGSALVVDGRVVHLSAFAA